MIEIAVNARFWYCPKCDPDQEEIDLIDGNLTKCDCPACGLDMEELVPCAEVMHSALMEGGFRFTFPDGDVFEDAI